MKREEEGYCKGESCNREGCKGVILERDIDGSCSCHISPPCGYCTQAKNYCSECDWDEEEERILAGNRETVYWTEYHNRPDVIEAKKRREEESKLFINMYAGKIPVDKFRSAHQSHTHFSQIIYGVHLNESRSEIEKKIKGSFGGRFSKFNNYSFEYIAYTD